MKSVVLYIAHTVNDYTLSQYCRLHHDLGNEKYDVVWLLAANESRKYNLSMNVGQMLTLQADDFQSLGYNPICNTIVPGSCHFIPLRFFLDNPEYHYYWFVEYDVVFTGNWSVLLENCDKELADYDFLSCHIERWQESNKDWLWWNEGNSCGYSIYDCIKGFNPICRYSDEALSCLDGYMKQGFSAHSEVMVTTCLYHHGLKIGDIGGTGEFTPKSYKNKYYIRGAGVNNGTMRWRPSFLMEEIKALGTKDKLFHPVKL